MIHVTRNANWKRGLLECSGTKRREQFEVVSGERYQHELVKLSTSKDAVMNVKKMEIGNLAAATVATCLRNRPVGEMMGRRKTDGLV